MRLVVKQDNRTVNEFQFAKGPVYIGRHANSQIMLPDRGVSRQHAVIFTTDDDKWVVEDLDSANKTYLNDEAIHKAEIKTGDCIRITDYSIEVDFEEGADTEEPAQMEDTLHLEAALTTPPHEIVVRKPDAGHAPAMRLPAKRAMDFSKATHAICKTRKIDELIPALLDILLKQFSAYHVWCALREQNTGPMTSHAGQRRDGKKVELSDIILSEKITQAVEKKQFLVLPRVAADIESKERIRSAMIAAIVAQTGCFGVLYVDNAMASEHYSLGDLDYLMMLSMHIAAVMENFQ
jgi:pSer/pThr/pTyr-binding forkhead associated (FHA) protein